MRSRTGYLLHAASAVFLLSVVMAAPSQGITFNDGLSHVIDGANSNYDEYDTMLVRNAGCGTILGSPCDSPGAATEVEIVSGGENASYLHIYDSSIITINGSDFMVDGTPVPYGDLSALTGTLTGTLALGDSLDNVFYQGGYDPTYTGIIGLVPEPSTAPLLALGLVGIAAGRRRRAT